MNNIFHQKFSIPCYDTDAAQLLKPVSFMNYAQEQANCHASVLGFGYDDMVTTRKNRMGAFQNAHKIPQPSHVA